MIFRVVVTGYNCERWATLCLQSIERAKYEHSVFLYVVNDGSTDKTEQVINEYLDLSRLKNYTWLINNENNEGAAFSRWRAIEKIRQCANDTDVVLFIDLDDFVLPNIFEVIAAAYTDGASLTFGNWADLHTGEINSLNFYPPDVLETLQFASFPFWATAPRSCLWRFVKQLTAEDFIFDDAWLVNCTDVALIFRLFELVGGLNIRPITEPLYIYRQATGNNTLERYGLAEKLRVAEQINTRYFYGDRSCYRA